MELILAVDDQPVVNPRRLIAEVTCQLRGLDFRYTMTSYSFARAAESPFPVGVI